MKLKPNMLLAASMVALAAGGAQAAITNANAIPGNSSALFVAMDSGASGTPTSSLTVDLGVNMTDFLQSFAGVVSGTGALTGAGTNAIWNFGTNSRSVNGSAVAGDYAWSTDVSSFFTNATGAVKWGVIAADVVSGAISASNSVANFNLLATGTPTQTNINQVTSPAALSNGVANFTNFVAGTVGGTHASHAEGASTATGGNGFLNTVLKGTFGGQLPWTNLSAVGAMTNFSLVNQQANPVVYQIGQSYGVDTVLASGAATFQYDGTANTLSYSIPSAVPEPSTLAMMAAGLAFVGSIARRRRRSL